MRRFLVCVPVMVALMWSVTVGAGAERIGRTVKNRESVRVYGGQSPPPQCPESYSPSNIPICNVGNAKDTCTGQMPANDNCNQIGYQCIWTCPPGLVDMMQDDDGYPGQPATVNCNTLKAFGNAPVCQWDGKSACACSTTMFYNGACTPNPLVQVAPCSIIISQPNQP
jgi:hypothetical protein